MADISKVQFLEIQESYYYGGPVTVRFRIVSDLIPDSKDRIGLFRVGWSLTTDYVTFESVSIPSRTGAETEKEFVCTFKDKLPSNDDDFFQFCYVDSRGIVCGVSSPFQFLEDYDIVVIDETESMIVVNSNSSPFAGRYEHVSLELSSDEKTKLEGLTRDLNEAQRLILKRDEELAEMKLAVDHTNEKLLTSQSTLSECDDRCLSYQEKEKTLNGTIQDLQKQLCLKAQDLELLKMEHSTTVDSLAAKQKSLDELTQQNNKMSVELTRYKKLYDNIDNLQAEWRSAETEYLDQIKSLRCALSNEKLKNQVSVEKKEVSTMVDELSLTDGPEDGTLQGADNSTLSAVASNNQSVISDVSHRVGEGDYVIPNISFRCELCDQRFPAKTSSRVLNEHVESHPKICPICTSSFAAFVDQNVFEAHVAEHLAETLKLPSGLMACPMCQEPFPEHILESHVQCHFQDEAYFPNLF